MDMEIRTLQISQIKPYPNNPRKNDEAVESVMESIKQCGYCQPILVDEDMVILAGHTRFKAIKRLGWEECPVVVRAGMTEEQKRKYRLLDNKTNEIAQWDNDLLMEELEGLDFEGFDFGFDFGKDDTGDAVEDDFDCEIPVEANAKPGDIYQLGRHRLMCGDSTSAEDVAKLTGGVLMDMLLTDPPYGVDYVGFKYNGNAIMAAIALTQLPYLDEGGRYPQQGALFRI